MEKSNNTPYLLTVIILTTAVLFTILGYHWGFTNNAYLDFGIESPPLAHAMQGIHDGRYKTPSALPVSVSFYELTNNTEYNIFFSKPLTEVIEEQTALALSPNGKSIDCSSLEFTTVTDDYLSDACFIGDSRTVGISLYSGITNAAFLCKTSLSIFDFDKPKITYNNKKTSIHQVLMEEQFAKIYIMLGINECGVGSPENYFEKYKSVVEEIRNLQPDALIFVEGSLLVTESKSRDKTSITNEKIAIRNEMISTLANQKDIFYIDINESSLCENNALIPAYTWDQVHIKAQYYEVWKDFILEHGIEKNT